MSFTQLWTQLLWKTLQWTCPTSRISHTLPPVALQTPAWARFKNLHCAFGEFRTQGCLVVGVLFVRAWCAAGPQRSSSYEPCDPGTKCTPCAGGSWFPGGACSLVDAWPGDLHTVVWAVWEFCAAVLALGNQSYAAYVAMQVIFTSTGAALACVR